MWLGACAFAASPKDGRWVPGLVLRGAIDTELAGSTASLAGRRTDVMVGARLGYALGLGHATLTPAVGLGFGWLHTETDGASPIRDGSDTDSELVEEGPERDGVESTGRTGLTPNTYGPRVEALVRGYVPLSSRISWVVSAGVEVAPLAHHGTFVTNGGSAPGEPIVSLRLGTAIAWGALP
jgi:hypothetical protein